MTHHWKQLVGGRPFDWGGKVDMTPADVATVLAKLARFTGHTRADADPYSVAQHSMLVSELMRRNGYSPNAQLAGLIHDAHEAILGDMSTPLKGELRESLGGAFVDAWASLEKHVDAEMCRIFGLRFGLFEACKPAIRKFDLIALEAERMAYMDPCEREWGTPKLPSECAFPGAQPWPWRHARDEFAGRFRLLSMSLI